MPKPPKTIADVAAHVIKQARAVPKPPKTIDPSPPNMTMADVAEYLNVTVRCVRYMVADGRLPAYKLGNRLLRFRRSDIDAAMEPTRDAL
jgi:excisionase family DNA binding protein